MLSVKWEWRISKYHLSLILYEYHLSILCEVSLIIIVLPAGYLPTTVGTSQTLSANPTLRIPSADWK